MSKQSDSNIDILMENSVDILAGEQVENSSQTSSIVSVVKDEVKQDADTEFDEKTSLSTSKLSSTSVETTTTSSESTTESSFKSSSTFKMTEITQQENKGFVFQKKRVFAYLQ
jgi:hypothetical protein